jgi:hypothetical protein
MSHLFWLAAWFLCSWLTVANLATSHSWAQSSSPEAEISGQCYRPALTELENAMLKLRESLFEVDKYVLTSPQYISQWRKYLKWKEQVGRLENWRIEDLSFWQRLQRRVTRNAAGLEHPSFVKYRLQLRIFLRLLQAFADPQLDGHYHTVVQSLQQQTEVALELMPKDRSRIGLMLHWLDAHGQIHPLGREYCDRWNQPNLIWKYSPPASVVANQECQTDRIHGRICGTPYRGHASTCKTVSLLPVLSDDMAILRLSIAGQVATRTVSHRSGVRVSSRSLYPFDATSQVQFSGSGWSCLPFEQYGSYHGWITSISTSGRLFRNKRQRHAATIGFHQARGEAEAETVHGLISRLNQETARTIERMNRTYQERWILPLKRLDRIPRASHYSSRSSSVEVRYVMARPGELASPGAAPEIDEKSDFILQVHETALNNLLSSTFPHSRISLNGLLKRIGLPHAGPTAGGSPLILTLPMARAIECFFQESKIILIIHAESLEHGGQRFADADVRMEYEFERGPEHWRLLRHQPPRVDSPGHPLGRHKLGIRDIAFRRVLTKVLNQNLPPRIDLEPSTLAQWLPQHQVKPLIESITIDKGWISLAWKMQQ